MSTNFYARMANDPFPVHLGEEAAGWRFLFRAHPDLGVMDTRSWLALVESATEIFDEYSNAWGMYEFLEEIERVADNKPRWMEPGDWTDDGNNFSQVEFR